MKEINNLKKGEFFKMKESGKTIYVYDGYNRYTKKYSSYKFSDINSFRELNKGTKVFTDFEF